MTRQQCRLDINHYIMFNNEIFIQIIAFYNVIFNYITITQLIFNRHSNKNCNCCNKNECSNKF